MVPFSIATGTMDFAQNLFIRIHGDAGIYGVGECSAFPMIVGETQGTCFELSKEFAAIWKGKDALDISKRMQELDAFCRGNGTAKSAFDMALHDLGAKSAGLPLYRFLGGKKKELETDLTIGIGTPTEMEATARKFIEDGVRIVKIKVGKIPEEDLERVRRIREAVGPGITLRIDANQGWDYDTAGRVLKQMGGLDIQFCEQPMRTWQDGELPLLRRQSPVPIMADESVFDHHDAKRLIAAGACDYVNIKFAKSGGILEAKRIDQVCKESQIPCMLGGMLESRLALTAFAHFASSRDNILFYDLDTCLLGHRIDPVLGGVVFRNYFLTLPESPGIGADVDDSFLEHCQKSEV
jgi:L-alanine-DL-glutamate epimerase-like enolase superfamily enzyme